MTETKITQIYTQAQITERVVEMGKEISEVYLRLTENTVTGEGTYWYAAFVDGSARASVLLDAVTGEVRAVGG